MLGPSQGSLPVGIIGAISTNCTMIVNFPPDWQPKLGSRTPVEIMGSISTICPVIVNFPPDSEEDPRKGQPKLSSWAELVGCARRLSSWAELVIFLANDVIFFMISLASDVMLHDFSWRTMLFFMVFPGERCYFSGFSLPSDVIFHDFTCCQARLSCIWRRKEIARAWATLFRRHLDCNCK